MTRLLLVLALLAAAMPAGAAPFELSYAGRLTDASGAPAGGPVELVVRFYRTDTGGAPLGVAEQRFPGMVLRDGLFQVPLTLSAAEYHTVFDGSSAVYVEVTDVTHDRTYPRQAFNAVPYALKVPIDGTTVQYDATGALTVPGLAAKADTTALTTALAAKADTTSLTSGLATKSDTTHSHTLAGEVTGDVGATVVSKLITKPVDTVVPNTVGQVLKWDGTKWYAGNDATVGGGSITSGTSVGTGTAIYKDAVAPDLRFKTVAGTAPLTITTPGAGDTITFSIGQASGVADGYLAQSDFVTFNNKQSAITAASVVNGGTFTSALQDGLELKPYGTAAGETGEARFDELAANGGNYVALKAPDNLTGNVTFTLPAADGTANFVLGTDGSGHLGWVAQPTVPASSDAVAEGATNLYFTQARVRGALSATSPISFNSGTGDFSLGTVGVAKGGTGATTLTTNGILFGNGTSAVGATAAGSQYQVLQAGAAGVPAFGALNLGQAAAVTGTLPVGNGGTGAATLTSNGIVYGNGASALAATAAGTQYQVLQAGASGVPTFGALNLGQAAAITGTLPVGNGGTGLSAAPANGQVPVGNGTGYALATISGGTGINVSNGAGTITIAATADPTTKVAKAGDTLTGALLEANGTAAAPSYSFSGSTGTGLYSSGANLLSLATNGSERLRVDAGGNVGVGVAPPNQKLDVGGNLRTTGGVYVPTGSAGLGFFEDDGSSAALKVGGLHLGGAYAGTTPTDGQIVTTGLAITLMPNGAAAMTVGTTGNVGIGTTSPSQLLDVRRSGGWASIFSTTYGTGYQGTFIGQSARGTSAAPTASQAGDPLAYFGGRGYGTTNFGGGGAGISAVAEEAWTDSAQGAALLFNSTTSGTVAQSERMRLDGNGRLGIATTAPRAALDVKGRAVAFGDASATIGATLAGNAGDGRVLVEKAAAANIASTVYRSNGVAKAEVGLVGDDSLHLKYATGAAGSETYADAMVVDTTNGYVGVGTASPGMRLDVNGAIAFRGAAAPAVSAAGTARVYVDSTTKDLRVSEDGKSYRLVGKVIDVPTTITVNSGGGADFTSIQAAIDWLRNFRLNANVTISVANGTYGAVSYRHPDGAYIYLVGNVASPSSVVINVGSNLWGVLVAGSELAQLKGFKFACNGVGNNSNGVLAELSSAIYDLSNIVATNCSQAVEAYTQSYINGSSLNLATSRVGVNASVNSMLYCASCTINPGDTTAGSNARGAYAYMHSIVEMNNSTITGAYMGALANYHSTVFLTSTSVTGNTYGVYSSYWANVMTLAGASVTSNSVNYTPAQGADGNVHSQNP